MFVTLLTLASVWGFGSKVDQHVVSLFGSSVADGAFCSGNCSGNAGTPGGPPGGCYQSRLRVYQAQAKENRSVFNNCHGGDSTAKLLDRFDQVVATKAGIVMIGLSLANEGLRCCNPATEPAAACKACHDAIYDHYRLGLLELLGNISATGALAVINSCYPNTDYTEEEYGYIKRMNLLTQTFGVPQTNFLGTIDDGHGRWVDGYHKNSGHPNDFGSTEMYYGIVPSLFEVMLAASKPAVPARASGTQFTTLGGSSISSSSNSSKNAASTIKYAVVEGDTMHSFAYVFYFRCQKCTGTIAQINGTEGPPSPPPSPVPPPPSPHPPSHCGTWCSDQKYQADTCGCGVCGSFGGCSWSCNPARSTSSHPLHKCPNRTTPTTMHAVQDDASYININSIAGSDNGGAPLRSVHIDAKTGGLVYSGGDNVIGGGDGADDAAGGPVNDGDWHMVALSHYYCNGTTTMYVDGVEAGQTKEKLVPTGFLVTKAAAGSSVDVRDLFVYRAGLNQEELNVLSSTKMMVVLQASLEVYAPLDSNSSTPAVNLAQSTSTVEIKL